MLFDLFISYRFFHLPFRFPLSHFKLTNSETLVTNAEIFYSRISLTKKSNPYSGYVDMCVCVWLVNFLHISFHFHTFQLDMHNFHIS